MKQTTTHAKISNEEQSDRAERLERLDRFNADVLDDIILEEQNINPHNCDHSPNHLLPLRIESHPTTNKQIIINKCMCCNAEIPEDYSIQGEEYAYMDESMIN